MGALIGTIFTLVAPLVGKLVTAATQGPLTPEQEAALDAELAAEVKSLRVSVMELIPRRDARNAEIDALGAEKFKGQ